MRRACRSGNLRAVPRMQVNGAELHYEDTGGGGPAVVFSHGLLWSGKMYRFQVEALRGNYRCITFDFRGQGQSPADVRGSMRALRGVLDRQGIADQLGSIRTPTLVVSGEEDVAVVPDRSRRTAERIPGARFVLMPGAGHSSSLEQPEAVTAALREFFAGR